MNILTQSFKDHPRTYRTLPDQEQIKMGARGNSMQQHKEKFKKNVPDVFQLIKACDDAGFYMNMSLLDTSFSPLTTFSWRDMAVQTHVENTFPRVDERSCPIGFIQRQHPKLSGIGSQGYETL